MQLAHARAALAGQGKQIFGMELPPEFAERDALRDECLAALRTWIPRLDQDARDQLRHVLKAYALPLT